MFNIFIRFKLDYSPKNSSRHVNVIQWNQDITNFYKTKYLAKRTIFFAPVIVKLMEKKLDITRDLCKIKLNPC